jgi:hypothetical protein
MGEMVGDQTANQAGLKKGGKKNNNHQFWNSKITGSLSIQSCLCTS